MNPQPSSYCLVFSAPVELSLKPTTFSRMHCGPDRQLTLCVRVDALVGGRVVSAREFQLDQGRAVLGSTIFEDPLRLVLAADTRTGRSRSVLRVSILAAPTTSRQKSELLTIAGTSSGGLGLWRLPEEQVGLFLGERWFKRRPDAGARTLERRSARSSPGSLIANLSEEVERLVVAQADSERRPARMRKERVSSVDIPSGTPGGAPRNLTTSWG